MSADPLAQTPGSTPSDPAGLHRLAENQQMPDRATLTVTLGELRAALAPGSPGVTTPLDALRALSDAATPGPWKHYTEDRWNGGDICRAEAPYECATTSGPDGDVSPEDAAFIVATVNYVRSLLASVPSEPPRGTDDAYLQGWRDAYARLRPSTPDAAEGLDVDLVRRASNVLDSLDAQADRPGPDHLVKVSVETWRDGIQPIVRALRAALRSAESERPTP